MTRSIPIKYQSKKKMYEFVVFLCLIGFVIFGIYKNGFAYLSMQKITLEEALKTLVFPVFSVITSLIIHSLKEKKLTFSLEGINEGLLCGLMIPTRFPIIPFLLISIIFHVANQFLKEKISTLSFLAVYKVSIILVGLLMNIGLENLVEMNTAYSYGSLDALFGKSIGAFGTTNIFLILLVFFFLATNFYYKKELPIYAFISYSLCFLGGLILNNSYPVSAFLNSSFFFAIVFLLPESKTSPALKKEQFIYGVSMGIISYLFIFIFNMLEGAYIALLIVNIIWLVYYLNRQKKLKKALG